MKQFAAKVGHDYPLVLGTDAVEKQLGSPKALPMTRIYDPTGAVLALWPGGSSSLSAFVDHQRIITGKLVHTADTAAIKAGIQKALSN